jgi:signal transduction histidine kinase
MNRLMVVLSVGVCLGLSNLSASAAEGKASAADAVAMVGKAVAAIKADGPDKAYAAFTAKDSRFTDRDLYVIVYDRQGKCLAHGANAKLVGKDLLENQDTDGKFYIKERMNLASSKPSFWQDYKFTNPTTRKVEPKSTYCEVMPDTIVCAGIYK